MDDPYHLTPESLATGVAECLPDMRHVASVHWSLQQLRGYGGAYFLDQIDSNLKAYRQGHENGYRHLCEALALRIAILHREGWTSVPFCGRNFESERLASEPSFPQTLEACLLSANEAQ